MEVLQNPTATGTQVETNEFIVTAWTPGLGVDPVKDYGLSPDAAQLRDYLFRALVANVMHAADPTLIERLLSAGARVWAAPGRFVVMTRDRNYFDVPELSAQIVLTPWVETGETLQ